MPSSLDKLSGERYLARVDGELIDRLDFTHVERRKSEWLDKV